MARHRKRLEANPRVKLTIKGLDRFAPADIRQRTRESDQWFETLEPYS